MASDLTNRIQWKDDYSVGVPELDEQHKGLINLINRLTEEGHRSSVVGDTLDALDRYAREHFGAEEALLRACGDQRLVGHVSLEDVVDKPVAKEGVYGVREGIGRGGETVDLLDRVQPLLEGSVLFRVLFQMLVAGRS